VVSFDTCDMARKSKHFFCGAENWVILRALSKNVQGVDVMITIFCDFGQFLAKKIGVFLKNQCHDQNFALLT
jgi:hypothetical protein